MTRERFILAVTCVILASFQVIQAFDVVSPCTKCVANTNCVNGGCVCQKNYTGNPYFHCRSVNNLYCSLNNDPVLTTLAGTKVRVHVLGATKFLQVTTRRSDLDHFCDVALYALMERLRGKTYVQSIDFLMKIPNVMFPSANVTLMLRLESSRNPNGSISWKYFTVDQGTTTLVDGVTFSFNSCNIDLAPHPSGFMLVDVGCCGIHIGLRPYTGRSPWYTPGLFVEIDTNNQPTFNNWQTSLEPLCLDPGSFTIADVQTATSISDPVKAMTYLAQTNLIDWSYLNVLYEERDFTENLRDCPANKRSRLFDEAWFTFTSPPFLNCISADKTDMSRVFLFITLELYYVCNDFLPACIVAKQSLENNCDLTRFDYLQEYYDRPCMVWTESTTPFLSV